MENEKKDTIAFASDHAGYRLKNILIDYFSGQGFTCIDCGTNSEESCDYPAFAEKGCGKVLSGEAFLTILCCGTGIGMSIAANKIKGIRAACLSDTFSAKYTRMHNDANVLCLGARVVGEGLACELADAFVKTSFEGGKHSRRVEMIHRIENGQ